MDNTEWFEAFYKKNINSLTQSAQRILGNRDAAEDVVQSVFVIALARQQEVMRHDNPVAWLYVTLKNQIGNEIQRTKHRQTISLDEIMELSSNDTYNECLSELLPYGLNESEKQILLLFYEKQLSHEQISAISGKSVLACRTCLHRARNKCKEILEKEKSLNTV